MELINRQAAINALTTYIYNLYKVVVGETLPVEDCRDAAESVIGELPTVQSETIHCKDCKHHWTHRCMDSIPTEICDLNQTFYDAEVDFCSLAKRRGEQDE